MKLVDFKTAFDEGTNPEINKSKDEINAFVALFKDYIADWTIE